jgi:arylsulfatase/uncharacterized sulfatase
MTGKILTPLLTGQQQSIYNDVDITAYEIGGNKALFKGDYKILFNRPPLGDGQWQLYNIVNDPGEANLLNKSHPKILNQLVKDYVQYEKDNGVLPIPDDYDQRKQVIKNAMKNRRKNQP